MKRREILRYTAFATGAAVSAPLMSTLFTGCTPQTTDNSGGYVLLFFNDTDFEIAKDLIDLILPKTDSPSATEVGVHQIIDTMVGTVYKKEDKDAYQKRFSSLVRYLENESEDKIDLLKKLDKSSDEELVDARKAYLDLKQQTISYYLSTETIAKNYLNYLPIPGDYEACISLSDVGGKAWAI